VTPPENAAATSAGSISGGAITPQGFTLETKMEEPGRRGSFIHFHAPSLVRYEPAPLDPESAAATKAAAEAAAARGEKAEARPGDPAGKLLTHLIFYASPIRPGWSKLIGTSFIIDAATNEPSKAASIFTTALPTWLRHVLGHEFMAGDLFILSRASSAYASEGRKWRSSYWLPTSADAGVVALRRWMETFGGGSDVPVLPASAAGVGVFGGPAEGGNSGGFSLPGLAPSEAAVAASTREQILSRYEQHTKTCAACRNALEATRAVARRSARIAAAASAAAVLIAAAAAQHAAALTAAAAQAASAASTGWASSAASALVGATQALGGPMAVVAFLVVVAAGCWLVRAGASRLEKAFINLPFDRLSKAFL
jgi:hypothetical protein